MSTSRAVTDSQRGRITGEDWERMQLDDVGQAGADPGARGMALRERITVLVLVLLSLAWALALLWAAPAAAFP